MYHPSSFFIFSPVQTTRKSRVFLIFLISKGWLVGFLLLRFLSVGRTVCQKCWAEPDVSRVRRLQETLSPINCAFRKLQLIIPMFRISVTRNRTTGLASLTMLGLIAQGGRLPSHGIFVLVLVVTVVT